MTGIELITQERKEQIDKHGRSVEKDKIHNTGYQLSKAAQTLLYPHISVEHQLSSCPDKWDRNIWNRMCSKPYNERIVLAGALIAAEIDRIQDDEI